eukprot:9576496-Heterocapsa_arctica.AAC.1
MREVPTSQGRAVGLLPEERPAIWIVKEKRRQAETGRERSTPGRKGRAESQEEVTDWEDGDPMDIQEDYQGQDPEEAGQ